MITLANIKRSVYNLWKKVEQLEGTIQNSGSSSIPVNTSDLTNDAKFISGKGDANGHEYIEIGGVKWATMNLGANSPEEQGLWYQWGGTTGHTYELILNNEYVISLASYPYFDSTLGGYSKYYSVDLKNSLDLEDDAVYAAWGGTWRTPNANELKLLAIYTDVLYLDNYNNTGIPVLVLTDKTDNTKQLIFPVNGFLYGNSSYGGPPQSTALLSNEVVSEGYGAINYLNLFDYGNSKIISLSQNSRYMAYLIRGVLDDNPSEKSSKVAITGSYLDLKDKPYIPPKQIQANWNLTSSYALDYIKNKPTIPVVPTNVSAFTNDSGYITSSRGYYFKQYLTFVAQESGTFTFTGNAINYSIDGGTTWVNLASATASPSVSAGNTIMWKALLTPNSDIGIGTFSSSGNFTVEGNAMSLLYGDNFSGQTSLSGKNYAFRDLFSGCTGVTSAANMILPATTLANSSYRNMFRNCTSLASAPTLPATTLSGSCYYGMFYGCTSLTTAPSILPATTLANYCYENMFYNCTSLTIAPMLPATTLSTGCYRSMFYGCTSLKSIICLATDKSATNCTYNWVGGVAASGTFTKAASMTGWTTGVNGIPSGWTTYNGTDTKRTLGIYDIYGNLNDSNIEFASNGTRFLREDGTWQDVSNSLNNETASQNGTTLSAVTTGEKYNWNNKANVWSGTQAQYTALSPNYDSNTIYIITAS